MGSDPERLSSADIGQLAEARPGANMYEIVRTARPTWLRSGQGGRVVLAENGQIVGPVTDLARYMPERVASLEYLPGYVARNRYSPNAYGTIGAVVALETR